MWLCMLILKKILRKLKKYWKIKMKNVNKFHGIYF